MLIDLCVKQWKTASLRDKVLHISTSKLILNIFQCYEAIKIFCEQGIKIACLSMHKNVILWVKWPTFFAKLMIVDLGTVTCTQENCENFKLSYKWVYAKVTNRWAEPFPSSRPRFPHLIVEWPIVKSLWLIEAHVSLVLF